MTILVHNPCNEHTRYYRYYNYFWDKFTEKLKEKYTVIEDRYFRKAHTQRSNISLQNGHKILLMECEYLVENLDSGDIYIMSVSDDLSHAILDLQDNNNLKKVLVSQFYRKKISSHVKQNNLHKYNPWIYFHSDYNTNLLDWRKKRSNIINYIDKLFFRGSNLESRPILKFFNNHSIFTGPNSIGCSKNYFNEAIHHSIGLSVAGVGEFCYRDIEYMAIGIPMIRFEYQSEMYHRLIPDYHYISIPYPSDMPLTNGFPTDRLGTKQHAEQIEEKFMSIISNKELLSFISQNAMKYYDDHLYCENSINLTLNILTEKYNEKF